MQFTGLADIVGYTEKKKNFETLVAIMQHVCKNDACPKWIQIWDKVGFVMVSYH